MATDVNFGTQRYFGFDPRSMPGCYIWSDADTLSGLGNGTTVNSWSNLGSGGTVTATGTTSNAVLNNRTVVNFTTAQTWTTGTTVNLSAYSLFAVQRQTGGTNRRVLQSVTNNQLFGYWQGYKRAVYVDANPNQLTTAVSDTNWDLMSHTRTASGPYTFNWNGTSLFTGTGAATNLTGLTINASSTAPTETSTCQIAEIILYSNVLTDAQVRQVEGYLAWKWGLQGNLPTGHPFKWGIPQMRLFQPVDVQDCVIWFDPADTTTVTKSGNQLLKIMSKGYQQGLYGSNVQATGNTSGSVWSAYPPPGVTNHGTSNFTTSSYNTMEFTRTVGGPGGVYGNGYNGSYMDVSGLSLTSKARSWALIFAPTASGIDSYANIFSSPNITTGTANNRQRGLLDYSTGGMYSWPVDYAPAEQIGFAPGSAMSTNGTPYLYAFRHNVTSTALPAYGSSNGTVQSLSFSGALNNGYATGTQEMILGIGLAYTRHVIMGDFIYYDRALATSEMKQLEGYIAWKWGMRSSLPSSHPYYNFPPATTLFTPPLISNIALWLDGADSTSNSMTFSGSNITVWKDKSGNGKDFTASGTGATLNTSPAGLLFTTNLYSSSYSAVVTNETIFLVCRYTNAGSGYIIGSTASGGREIGTYSTNTQIGLVNNTISWGALTSVGSVSPSNTFLTTGIVTSGSNTQIAVGGSSTFASSNITAFSGASTTQLGRENAAAFQFAGTINEIITYSRVLTASERQQVEGYLAWKWNIQNTLTTSHPFYKFRP